MDHMSVCQSVDSNLLHCVCQSSQERGFCDYQLFLEIAVYIEGPEPHSTLKQGVAENIDQ